VRTQLRLHHGQAWIFGFLPVGQNEGAKKANTLGEQRVSCRGCADSLGVKQAVEHLVQLKCHYGLTECFFIHDKHE